MNADNDNIEQYIFIIPISNLHITQEIKGEFRINRVLFVDKEKFSGIRKRLKIPYKISEIKKNFGPRKSFFSKPTAFAIVWHKGTLEEVETESFQLVKDELTVLAASQLGYIRRRSKSNVGLSGEYHNYSIKGLAIAQSSQTLSFRCKESMGRGLQAPLKLTKAWKNFQQETFFIDLLKIINGKVKIADAWRDDLERSAILVGKSYLSDDLPISFLLNMIVLEVLLLEQGESYLKVLPERMKAFLGWFGRWEFDEVIQRAYRLRNKFVHDGKFHEIEIRDLLFTDDLILNLLINLCKLTSRFQKKEDIIALAEQVRAERVLGLKPRVQPTIKYMSPMYSERDFSEI